MATANGTLTPPAGAGSASDHAPPKRRHDVETDASTTDAPELHAQTQRDILDILRKSDITPSFLDFQFDDATSEEPPLKKARRSSNDGDKTSISAKLSTAVYPSFARLREDVENVSDRLISTLRAGDATKDNQSPTRPSVDVLKRIQRVGAMQQLFKSVITREGGYSIPDAQNGFESQQVNGTASTNHRQDTNDRANPKARTVLTLFGNAPTPKQLFSSLQSAQDPRREPFIKTELPVEEMSLPNGLTATKVVPSSTVDAKQGPTFADAFPTPHSLPQLSPPKAQRRSTTKDSVVTWGFKDSLTPTSKRGGYTTQNIPVADWLGYGGIDPVQDAASPREKRKQRDRALSSSGDDARAARDTVALEAELERQEDALFRRAYSSFAPSYDNSKSLVDANLKNMVWWRRSGNRQYNERFGYDPALRDEMIAAPPPTASDDVIDKELATEDYEKLLDEYDETDQLPEDLPADTTDAEVVLRTISNLLETLASQQRVRNASLPSSVSVSRTPISPAPALVAKIGKPEEPGEDERETYDQLRREIAYLVLRLPPYAVAKLDGDRLAELGVSKLITFESDDYKGQLEDDQIARLNKYTAAAAAVGIASLSRSNSTSNPHYSSSARTPAIGQAANTRYGQSSNLGRTPVTAPIYNRQTSGQSLSYGTPTAAPRSQYSQPSQFSRPGASQQQSYGQSNSQQLYQQRPLPASGGYGSYGQVYGHNSTPGSQRPGTSSNAPLQQFQQVLHQRSLAAAATANPQSPNHNASPGKQGVYPGSPQPVGAGPLGSGHATPNYSSPAQTPVNGLQQARAPPPLVPRAASGTPQPPTQNQGSAQARPGVVNGHA